MIPKSICFVDVETSGMSAYRNRIIEIGIIKVENDKIVKEYKSLLNPQGRIDPYIETMTGINYSNLENAPTFYDIKEEILELLTDSVFVAHSVRFDYGFIRSEFKRVGINFSTKHFCSVKLARLLYPNQKKYNLDSIIKHFNIECKNRHRALDDAKVIYEFYKKSKQNIKPDLFEKAIDIVLKRTTVPSYISQELIDKLPENPGVYIFYDEKGLPLYIGKSINIKDRILSHFSNDHLDSKDMKISQRVRSIEAIETAGELGALLLESTLIKKHKPVLNRMLREKRKIPVMFKSVNKHGYYTIEIKVLDKIGLDQIENILGVFKSLKQAKDWVYQLAKAYTLCPKVLGLDKSNNYCFYYHLGQCNGACNNQENVLKYNLRFEEGFYQRKIKPWNFNTPIVIKEIGDKVESHVIDKWCYLGSIKNESETLEDITNDYSFDYDTYKILYKYIINPTNQKNISYFKTN